MKNNDLKTKKIKENLKKEKKRNLMTKLIGTSFLLQFFQYCLHVLNDLSANTSSLILLIESFKLFLILIIIYLLYSMWCNNLKIDIITIVILTMLSFALSIAYHILELGREMSYIPGVRIGSSDGWLSFIGSIGGGFITLIALKITLDHERKNIVMKNSRILLLFSVFTK